MRYVRLDDVKPARLNLDVPNIHKSGSVLGMQRLFGWPKGGQIQVGGYIYNVGVRVVDRLRGSYFLRGDHAGR